MGKALAQELANDAEHVVYGLHREIERACALRRQALQLRQARPR